MNKQALGFLGFLSLLAPVGVYLFSKTNDNNFLGFMGFLGFLGFFTYFNSDPDKKWVTYSQKEKMGTILLFLLALVLIIGTVTATIFTSK